jgi:hypothetical protein
MPSSSYRRRLRKTYTVPFSYNNTVTFTTNTSYSICTKNSELNTIQNYFYKILDNIILYNDFTSNVDIIQNIINTTQTTTDYYKIIDIIQNNLVSVIGNISSNTNPGIIQDRIDYIKTYIDQLSSDCVHLTPVSDMILQLIDTLIKSLDFSIVTSDVNQIQLYIDEKYTKMTYINNIQDNILSIICNISQNVNSAIISDRVEYLRQIIQNFSLM